MFYVLCVSFPPSHSLFLTLFRSRSFSLYVSRIFPENVVWEMKNTFNFFCVVVAVAVASKMCFFQPQDKFWDKQLTDGA